mmetsp:Transcript_57235/g.166062  ORF Transcript_57235/g.166062 Transcript_57235/m.166062 type:complete len:247 (+) Transcript_57235:174-914(+)
MSSASCAKRRLRPPVSKGPTSVRDSSTASDSAANSQSVSMVPGPRCARRATSAQVSGPGPSASASLGLGRRRKRSARASLPPQTWRLSARSIACATCCSRDASISMPHLDARLAIAASSSCRTGSAPNQRAERSTRLGPGALLVSKLAPGINRTAIPASAASPTSTRNHSGRVAKLRARRPASLAMSPSSPCVLRRSKRCQRAAVTGGTNAKISDIDATPATSLSSGKDAPRNQRIAATSLWTTTC